jgi:hypothetical protein
VFKTINALLALRDTWQAPGAGSQRDCARMSIGAAQSSVDVETVRLGFDEATLLYNL